MFEGRSDEVVEDNRHPPGTNCSSGYQFNQFKGIKRSAVRRRDHRPNVVLLESGGAPSTLYRYSCELSRFDRLLIQWGGTNLFSLCSVSEAGAAGLRAVLYLQMGYDAQAMGVADGGNFPAALKKVFSGGDCLPNQTAVCN